MTFRAERLSNGAVVAFDALARKYVVLDCTGQEHGFRRRVEDARAFAASLPGKPWVPPEPAPIHRSPRAMALGMASNEIGKLLGIGEETVRSHLKKVQAKLGARNRAHAAAEAIRQQLIP
jgi:hypothetical protein